MAGRAASRSGQIDVVGSRQLSPTVHSDCPQMMAPLEVWGELKSGIWMNSSGFRIEDRARNAHRVCTCRRCHYRERAAAGAPSSDALRRMAPGHRRVLGATVGRDVKKKGEPGRPAWEVESVAAVAESADRTAATEAVGIRRPDAEPGLRVEPGVGVEEFEVARPSPRGRPARLPSAKRRGGPNVAIVTSSQNCIKASWCVD